MQLIFMNDMTIFDLYEKFKECGSVTTDSRTLKGGEMFFALKGENFDGNEYALKALEAGAAYAVVNASSPIGVACASGNICEEVAGRLLIVEDTLKTLQELARWHRSMTFVDGKPLTVIGLTGTNGKTTTKELIKAVLSMKYNVTATEGNLNNSIGVPLTLLKINGDTQMAVVEMGASHPGDIKELVDIALPNFGLITNVGRAHLLGFGSFEGVMATKGELYDYLRRTSDKVFLNADNPYLCRMAAERNLQSDPERPYSLVIPYGLDYQGCKVLPSDAENPYLRVSLSADFGSGLVCTNLVGSYNADNVMAAIAVGRQFDVPMDDIVKAIEAYVPSNNRSQMVKTERNTLIVDAYNANPSSMEVALSNLSSVISDNKVAMLGDMLELGEESAALHSDILDKAMKLGLSLLCLVGKEFGSVCKNLQNDKVVCFSTSDELAAWLELNRIEGATILVKGSRGTRMEKVLPVL